MDVTKEQEEAVTREIDAHGEALKRAIELGDCPTCGNDLYTEINPRNITFKCSKGSCGWSAIYPIRTIGNSERAERDAEPTTPEFSIHQLAEIRSAVLTVIDDGDPKYAGARWEPWTFYVSVGVDQDKANENRLRLCDAIQSRLTAALKGKGA